MNFDKMRFRELSRELDQLLDREAVVLAELQKLFGGGSQPVTGKGEGTAPKAKKRQKGQLQKLVLQILDGYKTPKSVADIAAKVQKTRPGTTQASVATVLHGLSKRGKIVKTDPSTFFLPEASPDAVNVLPGPPRTVEPEQLES